jgi:hypothetical protein
MRFYNGQHRYYCGVDLHTKRMYLCILDQEGNKLLHRNVRAKPHDSWAPIPRYITGAVARCQKSTTLLLLAQFQPMAVWWSEQISPSALNRDRF